MVLLNKLQIWRDELNLIFIFSQWEVVDVNGMQRYACNLREAPECTI